MAETYGTINIPGDSTTVQSGDSVAVSAAFERTLGLVGGMDTANGSASTGSVVTIESSADAIDQFGENSELKEQVDLALNNGTGTIYAAGVSETQTTENFSSSTQGTLSNTPIFDPNVQPDHSVSETNNAAYSVNIFYGDAHGSTPDADTINLNPVTGDWKADATGTYDIQYTYGDYSSAITEVAKESPRILCALTEDSSLGTDVLTELNNRDVDFDFGHGFIAAEPEVTPGSYSDSFDDRRLSVVAGARAYTDTAETNMVRVLGAVAGRQAGRDLGDSTTYEGLNGIVSLHTDYTNSELSSFIDNQVYPLKQIRGSPTAVKDMTTSQDPRFERVYISEIVDEATEISHSISQDFTGEKNTSDNRTSLLESHASSYQEMADEDLLQAYTVSVSEGADDFEVDVSIGLDVIGIMDTIDVTVTVGDVVTNQGTT